VETRESNLVKMIFITWIICMGVIVVHWALQNWFAGKAIK